MIKSYDLNLPLWGPYNKKYLGASHIADEKLGLRFDVSLFPGFYRRSVMLPKDIMDSGVKMLASSPDVSHYIYRYELEWKDKVYIDADFLSDNNVMTIECSIVNNTDFCESVSLDACMSLHPCSQNHREIHDYKAEISDNIWIDATDYSEINCGCDLAVDGLYLGEKRESGFVHGNHLSKEFFGSNGHFARYKLPEKPFSEVGIRYRGEGSFKLILGERELSVTLPKSEEINYTVIKTDNTMCDTMEIIPLCLSADIDGFVLGNNCKNAKFVPAFDNFSPDITENGGLITVSFGDIKYTVEPVCDEYTVRKIVADDIGIVLSEKIHDHVSSTLFGNGEHETADIFIRPIFIPPNSKKCVKFKITAQKKCEFEANHEIYSPEFNAEGEKYSFSQKTMSAVTLTNVVWPIYSRKGFIKHNTPGRNWDSLYTWDSGFIGLGLSTIDIGRAKDCLNAYLTPESDIHSPCIFHGTPLPTQILLFAEIFAKTGDMKFLKKSYPLIKHQYDFFSNIKNSNDIGIFSLWHIFYNSGGWDDYPPQKYVHDNGLEENVKPVINTAFTVLCAKILKNHARLLGKDQTQFDRDIDLFSNALEKYAWDEDSGYYGYVATSKNHEILKNMGVNADMGLDGAYPFIADIPDKRRSERIISNIKNGLMTKIGLGAVDTRAPYYSESGYWNGSVWMPHQWIVWKALLDKNELSLANKIAFTALELWKNETDHTYNCYEHFMVKNGRGAGFHQFSGLSTPVLLWGEAYFKPYSTTSGFLSLITDKKVSENRLLFCFNGKGTVIVCMPEEKDYSFITTGKVSSVNKGAYAIQFDKETEENIIIEAKGTIQ